MSEQNRHPDLSCGDADGGGLARMVEAALVDLRGGIAGGLSPVETVQAPLILQAARRLAECGERIEQDGLTVEGSMG